MRIQEKLSLQLRAHRLATGEFYTAVPQKPVKSGFEDLRLLSITDCSAQPHKNYIGIRLSVDASTPRFAELHLFQVEALIRYGLEAGKTPLAHLAKNLKAETPTRIAPASEIFTEIVAQVEARYRRNNDHAGIEWLRTEIDSFEI